MKIAVFGLGFVGLTTAVGFAHKCPHAEIYGYEIDKNKVESLLRGKVPFFEKGLESALREALKKNLKITSDIDSALQGASVIFYCIGTPMSEDGSADLGFLKSAIESTVAKEAILAPECVLIIKSTVPPQSLESHFRPLLAKTRKGISLASNPEFLREGSAYSDFLEPDRIVVGLDSRDKIAREKISAIYAPFNAPIIFTSTSGAEFVKYLSNTMLATLISYANEMSLIAETLGGIDIKEAFQILHLDKRLCGANIASYIYPGLGFGGYCLPKDTFALFKKAQDCGFEAKILREVLRVNSEVLDFHAQKIARECPKNAKLGILGLSFKPCSDDVRSSKSADLVKKLIDFGFKNIIAFDPMASGAFQKTYNFKINYCESLEAILKTADALIIATAWDEFRDLKFHGKIYNLRYV